MTDVRPAPQQPPPGPAASQRGPSGPSQRGPSGPSQPPPAQPAPSQPPPPEPRAPVVHELRAWWFVAGGVALALLVLGLGHILWFAATLTLVLVGAAVARAMLDEQRAGGLVVRSRTIDVAVLLAVAAAIAALAAVLRLNPP